MSGTPLRRVDPIRGWTTLVAPLRGQRPFDREVDPRSAPDQPSEVGERCPFCPGNEVELSAILAESLPALPDRPWGSRAAANRYPFLASGDGAPADRAGVQEVLIDGPEHAEDPSDQPREQRRSAVRMWRARVGAARERDSRGEVHLFRNHGRAAGSSRRHPHTQLVQTATPTPGRTGMLERLAAGADRFLRAAPDPERVVLDGSGWRAWTLAAPLDPGHLRIAPVRPFGSLADATDVEVDALADLLGPLTGATLRAVGAAAYSLIVHETDHRAGAGAHLHLELRPRLSRSAGFEQSSGVGVCPSAPAADARAIRDELNRTTPT